MADHPPLLQILRPEEVERRRETAATPISPAVLPAVIERLRQFGAARRHAVDEQRAGASRETACELCGAGIQAQHGHLVDLANRSILCVCPGCYLLFMHDGAGGARFRAVPTRFERLPDFGAAHGPWDALDIPIGLAFFFKNSATGRVTAFYPSPAGATESELPLASWEALTQAVPAVATLASDVEALLVRRTADGTTAVLVPIDACYELVGVIRVTWRGLQGGDEMWHAVDQFFDSLIARADRSGFGSPL